MEDLEERVKQMELAYEARIKSLEEELRKAKTVPEQQSPAVGQSSQPTTSPVTLGRKELRITGKIGERGQKDTLTFSNLVRQIELGVKKGYKDEEVIAAVISSILPGMTLRSYLEGKSDLTLPQLRRVIRVHFHEKDATELYIQLSKLTQSNRESPQDYLLKALDLKQKILFASREDQAPVTYESQQVQAMFLHSLVTGLNNDSIKWEIKQLTQREVPLTDEEILEEVNKVAKQETERQGKLKQKVQTSAAIEIATVKPDDTEKIAPPKTKGKLHDEVTELKAEVKALKAALEQQGALARMLTRGRQRHSRGCDMCKAKGEGDGCDHCYKCGGNNHFARSCRVRRGQNQGNQEGFLLGDKEAPKTQ